MLFDRPFPVDVTLTKHAVTGLFEYGDRLIIMLKTPDNTQREMDRPASQLLKRLWLKWGFLFQEQWYKLTALILFIRAVHTVVKGSGGFPLSTPVCRRFISWP